MLINSIALLVVSVMFLVFVTVQINRMLPVPIRTQLAVQHHELMNLGSRSLAKLNLIRNTPKPGYAHKLVYMIKSGIKNIFGQNTETDNQLAEHLNTIGSHVDRLKKSRLADNEIIHKLSSFGWAKHLIEMVVHKAHKPDIKIDRLFRFVDAQLSQGRPKEEIKELLCKAGWKKEMVDMALSENIILK